MNWQTVVGSSWMVVCAMLAIASPAVSADSTCGDTGPCAAPLDDSSVGDNQSGDAGADREPPDDKKNG
jgi:hypothetical protein